MVLQFRTGKITLDDDSHFEIDEEYWPRTTNAECKCENTVITTVGAADCQ